MTLGNALSIIFFRCQRVATKPFTTSFSLPSTQPEIRCEIRYALKEAGHVSCVHDTLHLLLSHLTVSVINLFILLHSLSLTIPFFLPVFHIKSLCSLPRYHLSLSLVERKTNEMITIVQHFCMFFSIPVQFKVHVFVAHHEPWPAFLNCSLPPLPPTLCLSPSA